MKRRYALALVILAGCCVVLLMTQQTAPQSAPQPEPQPVEYTLRMRSDPYPMNLGRASLLFSVEGSDGTTIDDAQVTMTAQMDHRGMLPATGQATVAANGTYSILVNWSMPGHWMVNASAVLPDGTTLAETFTVYIYAVRPFDGINQSAYYRSDREIEAMENTNPENEYWVVIPQGAQEMTRTGQSEDMIPSVIELSVTGRNTLVIRNDDIADHSIGPYYIRAGETVRQVFLEPMNVVGLCSIRGNAEINIVVTAN